jgi:hypothetical protein
MHFLSAPEQTVDSTGDEIHNRPRATGAIPLGCSIELNRD